MVGPQFSFSPYLIYSSRRVSVPYKNHFPVAKQTCDLPPVQQRKEKPKQSEEFNFQGCSLCKKIKLSGKRIHTHTHHKIRVQTLQGPQPQHSSSHHGKFEPLLLKADSSV